MRISGFFGYKGITTMQHNDVISPFRKLFNDTNPTQILEIGTSYGGLTMIM